jgi:agmatine/peptidylarginine deiminase
MKASEMNTTNAFSSKREIFLSLMEVDQSNVSRYGIKIMKSLAEGLINSDEFEGHIGQLMTYCKQENIAI